MTGIDSFSNRVPPIPFSSHSLKTEGLETPPSQTSAVAKQQIDLLSAVSQCAGNSKNYFKSSVFPQKVKQLGPDQDLQFKSYGLLATLQRKIGHAFIYSENQLINIHKDHIEQLNQLSDGPEFSQMVSVFAPILTTSLLIPHAGKWFEGSFAQMELLPKAIQAILSSAIIGIARCMKRDEVYSQKSFNIVNVIGYLFKIIVAELNTVSKELDAAAALNPVEKQKAKFKIIAPIVKNILNMTFPQGHLNFPLFTPLAKYIWSQLENNWLPGLLIQLHESRKFAELGKENESAFLATESHRGAQNIIDSSKSLLTDYSKAIAYRLVGKSAVVKELDNESSENFYEYLAGQIREFGYAKNPGILMSWDIMGNLMENLFIHVFSNLSKNKKNEEASVAVATQILRTLSVFVKGNKAQIAKARARLESRKLTPKEMVENEAYSNQFIPLAQSFQEMMGLATAKEIPDILKGLLDILFMKRLPKLAADNYGIILQAAELYDAINQDEASKAKQDFSERSNNLFMLSELLGKIAATKLPVWLKNESSMIANSIASNLPKGADTVKAWMSTWINGQFVELLKSKNPDILNLWKFVERTVPQVIMHVIGSLTKNESDQRSVAFSAVNTILGNFVKFAEENRIFLHNFHKNLIENHRKPDEDETFISLFKPFCDELRADFGIGKGKALPVPELLNKTTEAQIEKIVPWLCAKLYCDFSTLFTSGITADQLGQQAGSEGIGKFSKVAADIVAQWTPQLLSENSEKIANAIIESIVPEVQEPEEINQRKKVELRRWIADQIRTFGPGLSETYPQIWKFLGVGFERFLAHIFFNLSKGNVLQGEATVFGVVKVIETIQHFVKENEKIIAEKVQALRVEQVENLFSHKDYVALFMPLSDSLQKLMGLSEFPGIINVVFKVVFNNIAPSQLAQSYQNFLVPIKDLYESIDAPISISRRAELEKFPGGARVASWCELAGKMVGEDIPKSVVDHEQRREIASQLALSFVKTLATPEQLGPLEARFAGKSEEIGTVSKEVYKAVDKLFGLYQWMEKWLDVKIETGVNSQHPEINKFWKFIEYHIDALAAHIMLNLIGKDHSGQDVLFVAANKIVGCYVKFNAQQGQKIEKLCVELRAKGFDVETHPEFVALFEPLLHEIRELAGIKKGQHLPLPVLLRDIGEIQLEKQVPRLFAALYSNFNPLKEQREASLERLRQVLNSKKGSEAIHEETIKAIENLCSFCSAEVIQSAKATGVSKTDQAHVKKQTRLDEEIPHMKNPKIVEGWKQLQNSLTSVLLQAVANRVQAIYKEGNGIDTRAVDEIISKILGAFFAYSEEDKVKIEQAFKIVDPFQQKLQLRRVFASRASELYDLLRSPDSGSKEEPLLLPLPLSLRKQVWTQLEKSVIPDFLANIYSEKIAGVKKAEENRVRLQLITGSSTRNEACEVLAEFISRFMPVFTKVEQEKLSDLVYDVVSDKLQESGNPDGLSVTDFLKKNELRVKQEVCHVLFSTSNVLSELQPFTKENVRPLLIHAFAELTDRIDRVENPISAKYQQNFLLNLGIRFMTVTKDHLKTLNGISKKHHQELFHAVEHDTVINEFSSLHKGVPQSTESLEARKQIKKTNEVIRDLRKRLQALKRYGFGIFYKSRVAFIRGQLKMHDAELRKAKEVEERERREFFFKPFTQTLLELTGFKSADDFPFPSPIKEELWEQLQSSLLPAVVSNVFEVMREPLTRQNMIISALEIYNLANEEGSIEENPDRLNDSIQDKLDEVTGDLLQEMVQMVPKSLIKSAFKIDQIKSSMAKKVGHSIRKALSQNYTLQKLVDEGIIAGLPKFHRSGIWKVQNEEGQWVEFVKDQHLKGNIKFFPAKINSHGKLVEISELDFAIPSELDALEADAIKNIDEEEVSFQQMRSLMRSTTHKAIDEMIKAPFIALFDIWAKAVKTVFGKYTPAVRSFFRFIGFRIIYKLLEMVCAVLFAAPKYAFWFFMDCHIANRVDEVIKAVQIDVHENLIYKLCDELANSLQNQQIKT